jgi:xylulokinase
VDGGDGFGTNLADIRRRCWSPAALAATAPGLAGRLPPLVARDETVGPVAPYLVQRFGFDPAARVVVGSGDNPCSLVGLGLIGDQRKRAVSLGTSDTYFGYLPQPDREGPPVGHVFGAPDGGGMFLLCFKNGSLARERIKNDFGLSWAAFSDLLLNTPAGNRGKVLLPYFLPEITPRVLEPAVRRFGGLAADDVAGHVRAVVEAQVVAMYRHSAWAGPRPRVVLVTAGGSENAGILHVIAQVFDAEVISFEVKNSAALGAAVRAAHRYFTDTGCPRSWAELADPFLAGGVAGRFHPQKDQVAAYRGSRGFAALHAACECCALQGGPDPAPAIAAFRSAFGH